MYLRRRLSTSETILLECPVNRCMFLEILQGIGGSTEAVGHFCRAVHDEENKLL